MLQIQGLRVETGGKEILHGVDLFIGAGETHALFGPNGSGKTTLLMAIMGFPRYKITGGRIIFKGQDITRASLDERARLGIGMSFQRPPVVRGVKTRDMVKACLGNRGDGDIVAGMAERLRIGELEQESKATKDEPASAEAAPARPPPIRKPHELRLPAVTTLSLANSTLRAIGGVAPTTATEAQPNIPPWPSSAEGGRA